MSDPIDAGRDVGDMSLTAALRQGRLKVDTYVDESLAAFQDWSEETATEMLCNGAAPRVLAVKPSRRQEGFMGADWLWWWLDPDGACFGMLSQAKRLHGAPGAREIDFLYRNKNGRQIDLLMHTAGDFGVPAVYTLYYGLPDQRADLRCREHSQACERCRQASVSVLTALEADEIALQPRHAASQAFVQGTPLEQLPFHDNRSRALYGYLLADGSLSPALKQFLQQPQRGARAAARVLLDRVAFERQLQFSGVSSDTVDVGGEPLFDTLPLDRGHFREPYFQHILRGLRAAPPAYVMDALVGGPLPSWVRQSVAGVVIART